MNRKTSATLALAVALAVSFEPETAHGRDDRWVSGFGQGVCESHVTSGAGNQITVACNCGSQFPSSIWFTLAGNSAPGDRVFLAFDGADAEDIWISNGEIGSNCRACADTFGYVLERLKRHAQVRVLFQNGDAATFTLRGSSAAVGECVPDFYR